MHGWIIVFFSWLAFQALVTLFLLSSSFPQKWLFLAFFYILRSSPENQVGYVSGCLPMQYWYANLLDLWGWIHTASISISLDQTRVY